MTTDALETIRAWHEALNTANIDRLVALSAGDVEVGGPRGSGHGAALLREWFGRSGAHIDPRRYFHRGETVVVEQEARWQAADSDELAAPQAVASVFQVQEGRVASVMRYPDLASALGAAGLSEADGTAEETRT